MNQLSQQQELTKQLEESIKKRTLDEEEIQKILENESYEAGIYQAINNINAKNPASGITIKAIRNDEHNYHANQIMSLTKKEQLGRGYRLEHLTFPLRRRNVRYNYKVRTGAMTEGVKGVARRDEPQFKITDTNGRILRASESFSKKNAVTLARNTNQTKFLPPVFGLTTTRKKELVGIIFFSDNINTDPNQLASIILQYDGGTIFRKHRFLTIEAAAEKAKRQIFNPTTNPDGNTYSSPEELFQHANDNDYNETLMRMKWERNNPRHQIGIFSDNLKSRLIAQFRALDMKINLDTEFIPISFYDNTKQAPDGPLRSYMLQEQKTDLEKALLETNDPELKAMAQVIDIYHKKKLTTANQNLTTQEKKKFYY